MKNVNPLSKDKIISAAMSKYKRKIDIGDYPESYNKNIDTKINTNIEEDIEKSIIKYTEAYVKHNTDTKKIKEIHKSHIQKNHVNNVKTIKDRRKCILQQIKFSHINSYSKNNTITFTKGVLGIRGDKTSGKTSLVHAIIFSIYGHNPAHHRYYDEETIKTQEIDCTSELTFKIDNNVYKITRIYNRPTKSNRNNRQIINIFKNNKNITSGTAKQTGDEIVKMVGELKNAKLLNIISISNRQLFIELNCNDKATFLKKIMKENKYDILCNHASEDVKNIKQKIKQMGIENITLQRDEIKLKKKLTEDKINNLCKITDDLKLQITDYDSVIKIIEKRQNAYNFNMKHISYIQQHLQIMLQYELQETGNMKFDKMILEGKKLKQKNIEIMNNTLQILLAHNNAISHKYDISSQLKNKYELEIELNKKNADIENLQSKLETLKETEKKYDEYDELQKQREYVENYVEITDKLSIELQKKFLDQIKEETNTILGEMTDSALTISLQYESVITNETKNELTEKIVCKIHKKIEKKYYEYSMSSASDTEKYMVDICIRIICIKLSHLRTIDMLILDDAFYFANSKNIDMIKKILKIMKKHITTIILLSDKKLITDMAGEKMVIKFNESDKESQITSET